MLTVHYSLSAAFVRETFVRTGEELVAQREVALDPATLTPQARAAYLDLRSRGTDTLADPATVRSVEMGYQSPRLLAARSDPLEADHLLEDGEVDALLVAWYARIVPARALVVVAVAERRAEDERQKAAYEIAWAESHARAVVTLAERRAEDERRVAAQKAASAAAAADKVAWIAAHGSDGLKARVAAGYDCQRRYVTERLSVELPDYALDFKNEAGWHGRSCPSDAAFAEEQSLAARGVVAEVVWLTRPVSPDDYSFEPFDPVEAVVVERYLGRYTALKVF